MRPREDDSDLAWLLTDVQHHCPDALVWHVRFARNLLAARQYGLGAPQFHHQPTAFPSGGPAGDDLTFPFDVFLVDATALGLTNPLNHHLFGRLRGDPT